MNIPVKQLDSGFSLPVYGLGTWQMGGRMAADNSNDQADIAAIQSALDHGITHLDTAELYGNGHSEELVGQAIKGYDRASLKIVSKVSAANQSYDGVVSALHASLQRLGTDYLDLYLLHRYPEPGIPISETMRAMDDLVAQGLVRHIGVCNMSVNRFVDTQNHTANKLVCNQLHYSLRCREAAVRGVIDYCQTNDVLVSAWGPLEKGLLVDSTLLQDIANTYHKTPYQVALNWLLAQPNVVTIPKTTQLAHLEENLGALGWDLSAADVARLTREFPNQLAVSDRAPLDYPADVPV